MRRRSALLPRLGLLLTTLGATACESEAEDRGTLILSVTSDMKLPADIDEVGLLVLRNGVTMIRQTVRVSGEPGDGKLPGSFSVQAGSDPDAQLTFRVFGSRNKSIRVTREAVARIPPNRTSYLRMPINWLCEGNVDTVKNENGDDVPEDKRCGAGTTCEAGTCVPSVVPEDALVATVPVSATPGCVDAPLCFANGKLAALDLTTCSVPLENDGAVNLAVVLDKTKEPAADGVCGFDACYIVLDRAEVGGWRVDNDKILLPGPVCDRVKAGLAAGVAITNAGEGTCATKTAEVGVCGPWFSPGTTNASTATGPSGFVPQGPAGGTGGAGGSDAGSGGAGAGAGGSDAGAGGSDAGAGGSDAGAGGSDAGAGGTGGDAGNGGQAPGGGGQAGNAGGAGDAGGGGQQGGGAGSPGGAGGAGQGGGGGGPLCPPNGVIDCGETDIDCGGFEVGLVQGRTCNVGLACDDDADCEIGLACIGTVPTRVCERKLLCGDSQPGTNLQKCAAQYPIVGVIGLDEADVVCGAATPFPCTITCNDAANNGNPVDGCECDGGAGTLCNLSMGNDANTPLIAVLAVRTGAPDLVARLHPTLLDGTNNPYAPLFEMLQPDFVDGDLAASSDGQAHFFGILAPGSGSTFLGKKATKSLFDSPLTALDAWQGFEFNAPDTFLPTTGRRPKISTTPSGQRSITAVTPMNNVTTATDAGQPGTATPVTNAVRPSVGLTDDTGTYWAGVTDNGTTDRLLLTLVPAGGGPFQTLDNKTLLRKGSSVQFFPRPTGGARLVYLDGSGTPWVLAPPWTDPPTQLVSGGGGGYDDFTLAGPGGGSSAVSFVGLRHVPPGDFDALGVAFSAKDLPFTSGPTTVTYESDLFDTPPVAVAYLDGATVITDLFVSRNGFVRDIRCRGTAPDACETTIQPPPLGMLHPRRLAAVALPTRAP